MGTVFFISDMLNNGSDAIQYLGLPQPKHSECLLMVPRGGNNRLQWENCSLSYMELCQTVAGTNGKFIELSMGKKGMY